MTRVHLDTDFLVYALERPGVERKRLLEAANTEAVIEISAVAWYEFARGPRSPERIAAARSFFADDGILPLSEELADRAAALFRRLGCPRSRAADIVIGVTAAAMEAALMTRNRRDFEGIPGLVLVGREE